MSLYLKEVFELMGWTENRNISESIVGKRQALNKPFYQLVSTHARVLHPSILQSNF